MKLQDKAEELWDSSHEQIPEDVYGIESYAGKNICTRANFMWACEEYGKLIQPITNTEYIRDLINKIDTLNGYLKAWEIDKKRPLEISSVITEAEIFVNDWLENNKA